MPALQQRIRSLLVNFLDSAVGAMQVYQVLRQGAVLVVAVLLAQSSLGPEEIGSYEWLVFLGYTLTFFWLSGLIQGLLSYLPAKPAEEQPSLLGQAYLVLLGLTLLVCLLAFLGKSWLIPLLSGQARLEHLLLFLVFLLVYQPTFLLEHLYLLRQKPRSILQVAWISFLGQIAASALPAFFGLGIAGVLSGQLIFALVRHLWLLLALYRIKAFSRPDQQALYWLRLSLPLAAYGLIGGLHPAFDNWLVGWFYPGDERIFAIFRYGARELPFANALSSALNTALIPVLSAGFQEALPLVREKSRQLFHQLFPLSILLLLSSSWWFPLVFSADFRPAVPVFNIFLLLTISRVVPSRALLIARQENQFLLWLSLAELGVHLLLGLLLAGPFGLAGIAWSTVVVFSLEKAVQCWYLSYRYGISPGQYLDLPWFWAYSLVFLLTFAYTVS